MQQPWVFTVNSKATALGIHDIVNDGAHTKDTMSQYAVYAPGSAMVNSMYCLLSSTFLHK